MTASPRVSVVLATRDGARWVEEQVRSVLDQTHPVDEVLVVDDGSTDGTPDLIAALAPHAVIVRRSEALGVVKNFEDGLRRSTGDVLLLSDQDDRWEPTKVARVLGALADRPTASGVFTDGWEIDGDGLRTGRRLWEPAGLDTDALAEWETDPLGRLLHGNCVTGATLAIRRSALELVLPFPETGYHDGWIALLLAAVGWPLMALPEQLISYRVHGANLSGGLVPASRLGGLKWYVGQGHVAEDIDVRQLTPAIARLHEQGHDASRLEDKLAFMRRRRALPSGLLQRRRVLSEADMRRGYRSYTNGRLPLLLDAVRGSAKAT